jgi:polyhydroxybutyrate depolymerase
MKGAMLNPRLRPLALGLAALLLAAPSGYADSVITSDGVQRHYEIFRSNNAKGPRPAVFLLHGGGSTAAEMRRYTGFDDLAEQAGIVAVYPQGIDKDWNAGAGAEDRFLIELADDLAARGLVDRRRVYIAGISNGGIMALQMACSHADRIAGIAVIAASLPSDFDCQPQRRLPVIFINGVADRLIPYTSGASATGANGASATTGSVVSVQDSLVVFARLEGCRTRHSRLLPAPAPPDGTRAMVYDYGGCAPGGALESIAIAGGTHSWPNARPDVTLPSIQTPPSRAIEANSEFWRFFARHPPLP